MKIKLSLLLLLFSALCFSQFSKTHYIPPLCNSNDVLVGQQFIYISTPSTTAVSVAIKEIGGNTINVSITRDTPYILDVANANRFTLPESMCNTVMNNKGYIIEASDMVYVSGRVDTQDGNQAGELVSKGLASLGKTFRIGGFLNLNCQSYGTIHLTFISILATENNTTVNFSNIKTGALLIGNAAVGNTPPSITLNAGESYMIAVKGSHDENRDALIGSLVTADKNIVVNCGSFGGTNAIGNLDLGFDQIVSAERTGTEYIFVKSTGTDVVENALIIANDNNTQVFLNGNATPTITLNAGQYIQFDGNNYTANGTMYIRTNKNVFAYQTVGDDGRTDQANQELFFVPPLSCQTPKSIDNIPNIELIGSRIFTGRVTLTTKTGSALTFRIDNNTYTTSNLPSGIILTGPIAVQGNPNYECYVITGLTGNVAVESTTELYLAAYGTDNAATFGGYYSGFTFKPEIAFNQLDVTQQGCIPNIVLSVSTVAGFDTYQWYKDGNLISGATQDTYTPTVPGIYSVKATLSACSISIFSDDIPVSVCNPDVDGDGAQDNYDVDMDNDGIPNCEESYGDAPFQMASLASGTLTIGAYSNSVTGVISNVGSNSVTSLGNGDFAFQVAATSGNYTEYAMTFAQPISIKVDYPSSVISGYELNPDATYIISTNYYKTITVLNAGNQLLIDTNYDGVYESGVARYSSFEIRFKLNSPTALAAGTGTFSFVSYLTNSLKIKVLNTSNTIDTKGTFRVQASCVPRDSDGDGVFDYLDSDSDNDGIPDNIEAYGHSITLSTDANEDGLNDAYNSLSLNDFDNDTVPNFLDLDSDNDGMYDLLESGSNATDSNLDGMIDGTVNANGVPISVAGSSIINYTILNTDGDAQYNFIDLDSDADGCNDVLEAGFQDPNHDGYLGNNTPSVNSQGVVTSGTGYTVPATQDYLVNQSTSLDLSTYQDLICSNDPSYYITLNSTVPSSLQGFYTVSWTLNSNVISGQSGYTLAANTAGTYQAIITNIYGCQYIKNFIISASSNAVIQDVIVSDFTDNNTIEVVATGLGNYVYNIDNGSWQTSSIFNFVSAGPHIVGVKDLNGCVPITYANVFVMYAPKFFTPNGDGNNDYWNIKGASLYVNSNINVFIFDRYGKLVKEFYSGSQGWDGRYEGNLLPSDDYWYLIKLPSGREVRGHFAMIR